MTVVFSDRCTIISSTREIATTYDGVGARIAILEDAFHVSEIRNESGIRYCSCCLGRKLTFLNDSVLKGL